MVGGLRGATLVVQCGATGSVILADSEPGIARNVAGLLTGLCNTAGRNIVDVGIIQPGAFDQFTVGEGE